MILVLEDCADDFFFLERALERACVALPIIRVANGDDAIRYMKADAEFSDRSTCPLPTVIIADLKMPGSGGLEFIEWLRKHSDYKSTPVIVVSSSTIAADVASAYALGANWFIEKPLTPEGYDAVARSLREWLKIIRLPARR